MRPVSMTSLRPANVVSTRCICFFACGIQNARAAILAPARGCHRLVTESKLLNQLAVRLDVRAPQIVQKSATFAYHLQEATATVMIFAVLAEVFREIIDALGQDRDLNLCRPGIAFVRPVLETRGRFVDSHF